MISKLIPILKTSKNDRNAEMIVYSQFRSTKSPVTFENWYDYKFLAAYTIAFLTLVRYTSVIFEKREKGKGKTMYLVYLKMAIQDLSTGQKLTGNLQSLTEKGFDEK
jgi:hypothetical protein